MCILFTTAKKKKMKKVLMEGSAPEVPFPGAVYYPASLV